MRVAIAELSHETNVFSSVLTDLAAFERSGIYRGTEVIEARRGTATTSAG